MSSRKFIETKILRIAYFLLYCLEPRHFLRLTDWNMSRTGAMHTRLYALRPEAA